MPSKRSRVEESDDLSSDDLSQEPIAKSPAPKKRQAEAACKSSGCRTKSASTATKTAQRGKRHAPTAVSRKVESYEEHDDDDDDGSIESSIESCSGAQDVGAVFQLACQTIADQQKKAAAKAAHKSKRAKTDAFEKAQKEMADNTTKAIAEFQKEVDAAEKLSISYMNKTKEEVSDVNAQVLQLAEEVAKTLKQVQKSQGNVSTAIDDFNEVGERIITSLQTKLNKVVDRLTLELKADIGQSMKLEGVMSEINKLCRQLQQELPPGVLVA